MRDLFPLPERPSNDRLQMIGGHPVLGSFDPLKPVQPDNSGYDLFSQRKLGSVDARGLPIPRDPMQIMAEQEQRFRGGDS